jgi:hypothetical protein
VSRLSKSTVLISLGIENIVIERRSGWFSRVTTGPVEYAIQGLGLDRAERTLAALEYALQDPRWHTGRAKVTLTNALVRYAVVPANSQMSGIADERSLAVLKLQQVHGATSPALEVRLSSPMTGKDQIAAGLESAFLEKCFAAFSRARLHVVSIEPLLMRLFNESRSRFRAREFMFACFEPGLLGLACVRAGAWASLGFSPFEGSPLDALKTRLKQADLAEEDPRGLPRLLYLRGLHADSVMEKEILGFRCAVLEKGQV